MGLIENTYKKKNNYFLSNKEYVVPGNWYAPEKYLNGKKSVCYTELIDITSLAGDWSGFCVQLQYKKYWLIPFSQENLWPKLGGFKLYTGGKIHIAKAKYGDELPKIIEVAREIYKDEIL